MPVNDAVIRFEVDHWHVSVNDYATTHEVEPRTFNTMIDEVRRLIKESQQVPKEQP
jgi:hypothetical protein